MLSIVPMNLSTQPATDTECDPLGSGGPNRRVVMAKPKELGLDTLNLYAGQRPDSPRGARATPPYQTTSFARQDSEHAASLFAVERATHVYSRIWNPTIDVLEERVTRLENGVGGSVRAPLFVQALRERTAVKRSVKRMN
tara:strand:- start:166 stop:585 length:420 start_codon:yes stop_codon:yes gene_type:complete